MLNTKLLGNSQLLLSMLIVKIILVGKIIGNHCLYFITTQNSMSCTAYGGKGHQGTSMVECFHD
jgi:hypothetical protein